MRVTDDGIPVQDLIEAIKQAIKAASISSTDTGRDLRVGAAHLTLNAVATRTLGGGIEFRIPFIGMPVTVGVKVTSQDTHQIDIGLVPPDLTDRPELREDDISSVLADAITTTRAAMASAAAGDDPFTLTTSSVRIAFAVTEEGTIALGLNGELASEVTHSLTVTMLPA
jgi:Trypsin-co-occurring domain 2